MRLPACWLMLELMPKGSFPIIMLEYSGVPVDMMMWSGMPHSFGSKVLHPGLWHTWGFGGGVLGEGTWRLGGCGDCYSLKPWSFEYGNGLGGFCLDICLCNLQPGAYWLVAAWAVMCTHDYVGMVHGVALSGLCMSA